MVTWSKAKYAVSGFIVGAVFFGSIGFAASSTQSIQVSLQKVFFRINGVDKTTANGTYNNNGKTVPASFIYKGTNYLPMRMVAEMLGKEVNWDGKNSTVLVGSEKGEGKYLSDLAPAKDESGGYLVSNKDIVVNSQSYTKGILYNRSTLSRGQGLTTYNIDGNFKKFTAVLGVGEGGEYSKVVISGDDKILYSSVLPEGVTPQDLSLDVSGVLELKIDVYGSGRLYFANPYLLK